MKRAEKIYNSEQQIIGLIDDTKFKIKAEALEKERIEAELSEIRAWLAKNDINNMGRVTEALRQKWHAQFDRVESIRIQIKKLSSHRATMESKLVILKGKLAAFSTEPMAFLPDRSVV